MLFDPSPKDRRSDLFGRDPDFRKLKQCIDDKLPLVVLVGTRRVGKTSLLQAFLSEMEGHSIYIDPRHLASSDSISKDDVVKLFQSSLQKFIDDNTRGGRWKKLRPFVTPIKGFSAGMVGLQLDFSGKNSAEIQALFLQLDAWAKEHGRLVLAIDEAQKFAKAKRETDLTELLAYLYDKCKNITIILTGSEIGLLYEFLGFDNEEAALYGRSRYDLKLGPLTEVESTEFLLRGFKEKGMEQEATAKMEVIKRAVLNLDGIIGWLIVFANRCVQKCSINEEFITQTQKEGSKLARRQFEKYLKTKQDKESALREVMQEAAKLHFSDFISKNVDNPARLPLVKELLQEEYLRLIEGRYLITDPLLFYSFQQ